MKRRLTAKAGGLLVTAALLLSQLTAFPANAANLTGKDISECTYTLDLNGQVLEINKPVELTLASMGVDAAATVTEVWLAFSADTSTGKAVQPAFGYSAPGCGEYDWYQEGFYIGTASAVMTAVFEVPSEYPLPNDFQFQLWGAGDDGITSVKLNTVGVVTKGGAGIGTVTRRGDVNNDRAVNVADVVALVQFLTGRSGELEKPANADLDANNRLNAADLTLLKRGLIDGSLGGGGDTSDETGMEFVSHLKVGWNLGNTLDSTGGETAWGNPFTTKAMIDGVKAAGFNTVRVPVTWGENMGGAPDYKVNDSWMNRVQEVVDYVIDNDMYCILNSHHDTSWQSPRNSVVDQNCAQLKALWTQISNRFKGYDNHLIFETMNEPRLVGTNLEWSGGDSEARQCINKMNAAALEAIRATGGNNEKRFVMMPGHAASPDAVVVNDIVLPADDHLIVSIHAYAPYDFALNKNGTANWNQSSDSYAIVQNFENVKRLFLSKGIPVIVGEFGALNKNNESTRAEWVEYYLKTADSYGIPCVWWDNNLFNSTGENFGLFNRATLQIEYPQIMAAINRAVANRG